MDTANGPQYVQLIITYNREREILSSLIPVPAGPVSCAAGTRGLTDARETSYTMATQPSAGNPMSLVEGLRQIRREARNSLAEVQHSLADVKDYLSEAYASVVGAKFTLNELNFSLEDVDQSLNEIQDSLNSIERTLCSARLISPMEKQAMDEKSGMKDGAKNEV